MAENKYQVYKQLDKNGRVLSLKFKAGTFVTAKSFLDSITEVGVYRLLGNGKNIIREVTGTKGGTS